LTEKRAVITTQWALRILMFILVCVTELHSGLCFSGAYRLDARGGAERERARERAGERGNERASERGGEREREREGEWYIYIYM